MQIERIRNFYLIEGRLRLIFNELFYRLPNGKEAIAPIELSYLKGLLSPTTICYPYLDDNVFILKCLFHINVLPDKNYDDYIILKSKEVWVLLHRLYDKSFSIISVVKTPGGIS